MNPYDKTHELADLLRQQPEILQLSQCKARIMQNPAAKRMMDDFFERQRALLKLYEAGVRPEDAQIQEVQRLLEVMSGNSLCKEYIDLEMRIAQMMNDIQKILNEVIKEAAWA